MYLINIKTAEMKKFILLVVLFIASISLFSQEGFYIDKYNVDINIQESGEIKIIENIDVVFTEKRRGIFRNVPTRYEVNGKILKINLDDIEVDRWKYKTTKEKNQTVIRIGDANRYVTGSQSYRISYKTRSVFSIYEDHDEFYWNAIGAEWDVPINVAELTVRFPYTWRDQITEFITKVGNANSSGQTIDMVKDENQFSISEKISLAPRQGVTVAFKIPKNLLPAAAEIKQEPEANGLVNVDDRTKDWLSLIPAGLAALLFGRWRKNGKRQSDPADIPMQYHPPADMSPAETGTFYDYKVNRRDIISLLPYWGDRGYLRMKNIAEGDGDVYFEKIKDIPHDEPQYAIDLFNDLFQSADHTLLSDLKEKFYKSMSSASSAIMKDVKDQELFDEHALKTYHSVWIVISGILLIVGGVIIASLINSISLGIASAVLGLFAISIYFFKPKLSDKGYDLHQYLRGFYNFLKDPNPEKLNELIKEDSNYLFKVFPYAMAFGLDKEWEEFFKEWEVNTPDWYMYGMPMYGNGRHHTMGHFTKSFGAHKIEQVFYSAPAPAPGSSGGGFSGGGSVGGGFGGGGGGSW